VSEVTVRDAAPDDAEPIVRVRETRRFARTESEEWIARVLARSADEAALHVACIADEVVGYGHAARFEPPAGSPPHAAPPGHYLVGLLVRPDARRRGVARALVASRLRWVFERADAAWYFSDDDNVASVRLHASFGFEAVTSRFWFPGLRHPEAPMTLYRAARPTS
jgi:GNAT superfamily N-acetyltransferase